MSVVKTYEVDVVYRGKDQNAQSTADHIGASIGFLQGGLDSVNSGLGVATGMIERVGMVAVSAVGVGAVAAFGLLSSGVGGLNAELEASRIGIAATIGDSGIANGFTESLGLARDTMAEIRTAAAAIPGETRDLLGIFRDIQQPAQAAGATLHQMVGDAANIASSAATLGVEFQQAGREYAQLLQGRAGAHNTFGMRLGITDAESFNRMGAAARLAFVEARVASVGGGAALEAYRHSWMGLTGSVMDFVHMSEQRLTEPLFDAAKVRLEEITQYLDVHGPEINATLDRWGSSLAHGFDVAYESGTRLVTYVRDHWREFRDELVRDGKHIAEVYVGLQATRGALGLASGGLQMAAWANQAGLLGGGGALEGLGGGALAAGAGAAAALVIPAAVAVADGSFDVASAATTMGGALGDLRTNLSDLGTSLQPVMDVVGTTVLTGMTTLGSGLIELASGVVWTADAIVGGVGAILSNIPGASELGDALSGRRTWVDGHGEVNLTAGEAAASGARGAAHLRGWMASRRAAQRGTDAAQAAYEQAQVGDPSGSSWETPAMRAFIARHPVQRPNAHGTIVHQTNHFRIEQSDNPERLALTVQHVLQREVRAPTQSPRAGVTTLRP